MMANDNARSEAPLERKRINFAAAFEHPVLVASLALLFFTGALFGHSLLGDIFSGPVDKAKTVIEVVRLDLDRDADNPTSLIRTTPLSLDSERKAILSHQLINEALIKAHLDKGWSSPLPADMTALSSAILEGMSVDQGADANQLDITLSSDAIKSTDHNVVDLVGMIARRYVELRNQERHRQKEQALGWADKKLAYWQGAIEILSSPKPADASGSLTLAAAAQTDSKTLLNFLVDATKFAQTETLSEIQNAFSVTDEWRREQSLKTLELDYSSLSEDLKRLENISTQAPQTQQARQTKASNLRDTEEKLALFRKDLDALISSGLLDKPAAIIKMPASAIASQSVSTSRWTVIIAIAAALSILLAMTLTAAISRLRSGDASDRMSVLTDPHWPMKPHQRLEDQQPVQGT